MSSSSAIRNPLLLPSPPLRGRGEQDKSVRRSKGYMNAVEIDHVTKTFGQHTAVDDLSLVVPIHTVYGFIGPNGSGKTTTLRMIMRILHPDRGTILVLGERSLGAANNRVGYLPEERGLYKQMKVRDILRFYAELKGRRDSKATIDSWL